MSLTNYSPTSSTTTATATATTTTTTKRAAYHSDMISSFFFDVTVSAIVLDRSVGSGLISRPNRSTGPENDCSGVLGQDCHAYLGGSDESDRGYQENKQKLNEINNFCNIKFEFQRIPNTFVTLIRVCENKTRQRSSEVK